MLKTIEEIKEAEIEAGVVVNGIDNPNILSVDSTDPQPTTSDDAGPTGDEAEAEEEETEETESDEEAEEKAEKKVKNKETKEKPESDKVAKRIGVLTKKYRTAERERDYQKEKRLEAEAKLKKFKRSSGQ